MDDNVDGYITDDMTTTSLPFEGALIRIALPHSSSLITFVTSFVAEELNSQWNATHANGSSVGVTQSQRPLENQSGWSTETIIKVTAIIILMVLTPIGNIALIAASMCHGKLRQKRVNVFLANLAAGDLMVCVVTMSTEILFVAFGGDWVLGPIGCKITVYGQIVTLASSTFLLTAMSMDRYQVLVRPLRSLVGPPRIWRKVAISWLLALIFASPQLVIWVQTDEGRYADGRIRHMCRSKGYTAEWQRKVYFTFLTTYILLVPTIIMTYCYTNIVYVVWMRGNSAMYGSGEQQLRFVFSRRNTEQKPLPDRPQEPLPREAKCSVATAAVAAGASPPSSGATLPPQIRIITDNSDDAAAMRRRRQSSRTSRYSSISSQPRNSTAGGNNCGVVSSSKRKVVVMTMSVIIGFLVCETPYFVVCLIRIYSNYRFKLQYLLSFSEIMAMAHSALNPILYFIFSKSTTNRACERLCLTCQRRQRNRQSGGKGGNDSMAGACFCVRNGSRATLSRGQFLDASSSSDDVDTKITCSSMAAGDGINNGTASRAPKFIGDHKRRRHTQNNNADNFCPLVLHQQRSYNGQRTTMYSTTTSTMTTSSGSESSSSAAVPMRRAYSYCVRSDSVNVQRTNHIPLDTYVLRQNGAVLWVNKGNSRQIPSSPTDTSTNNKNNLI